MEYRKYRYTKAGTFGIELGTAFKAIGFGFDFGGGDGDQITLSIHLYFIGIYLSYGAKFIYRITSWISKQIGDKYSRSFNSHIHLYHGALSITLFGDHIGENAWINKYWNLDRMIKGKPSHVILTLKEGATDIVMPEKRYPATYKIQTYIWTYPRWFKKRHTSISFDFPEGIPHEGKGESEWDCGMDYTFGMSLNYKDSLRKACDEVAISILKQRQRHSSLDGYLNLKPAVRGGVN